MNLGTYKDEDEDKEINEIIDRLGDTEKKEDDCIHEFILEKIDEFEERINTRIGNLEEKLDKLIAIFEKDISKSCSKMSGHIDFVENVYETVKSPLTYICNKVNYISGTREPLELSDVAYDDQ